jgi:hypothetical protein
MGCYTVFVRFFVPSFYKVSLFFLKDVIKKTHHIMSYKRMSHSSLSDSNCFRHIIPLPLFFTAPLHPPPFSPLFLSFLSSLFSSLSSFYFSLHRLSYSILRPNPFPLFLFLFTCLYTHVSNRSPEHPRLFLLRKTCSTLLFLKEGMSTIEK